MRLTFIIYMVVITVTLNSSCVSLIRDSTGKMIKECPVHHMPFERIAVETVYGLPSKASFTSHEVSKTEFPYARTRSLRGCMVGPFSRFNNYDTVSACLDCNQAKRKYLKNEGRDKHTGQPSKSDVFSNTSKRFN